MALYSHNPIATNGTIDAARYNTDHQNHVNASVPTSIEDFSSDVAEMQETADPGEVGSETLALSLADEIKAIRFAIKDATGKTQWYQTPATTLQALNDRFPLPTADIADNAITSAKIANSAVDSSEIATDAVGTSELATDAVTQGIIAAGAVHQGEIETAQTFVTIANGGGTATTTTPGDYSFMVRHGVTAAANFDDIGLVNTGTAISTTLPANTIYAGAAPAVSGSGDLRAYYRYVQSSPPYDMGDGAVHGFVYAEVDQDGQLYSWTVSQDPPWAYDGPTNCRGDFVTKDGRKYALDRKWTMSDVHGGHVSFDEYFYDNPDMYFKIDMERKMRDMDVLPTTLALTKPRNDRRVVLLDPMSKTVERLSSYCKPGNTEIFEVMNYIKIGDDLLTRAGPTGVAQVECGLR